MPTCGRTAVKVFAKKGESVYLYLAQYYGNDMKAFDYIINHQKKKRLDAADNGYLLCRFSATI